MKGCGDAPGAVADPPVHHVAEAVLLTGRVGACTVGHDQRSGLPVTLG